MLLIQGEVTHSLPSPYYSKDNASSKDWCFLIDKDVGNLAFSIH